MFKKKNGDITIFFKPVSQSSQDSSQPSIASSPPSPSPQVPRAPGRPSRGPDSPLSPLFGVPSSSLGVQRDSPRRTSKVSRDLVIPGSDDEDGDDSDASLEDLAVLLQTKPKLTAKPSPPGRGPFNPCVTPRAKRTALEFHSSPLAIMPKHKFDMKALLSHAEKDNATDASAKRMEEVLADNKATATRTVSGIRPGGHDALKGHGVPLGEAGEEEINQEKLKRAIERTEATSRQKRFYFFEPAVEQEMDSSTHARETFPSGVAEGTWAFLRDDSSREQHFISGLPLAIQSHKEDLPDEIFLWVLEELCFVKTTPLRRVYVDLLTLCPEQVSRLVEEDRLKLLFQNLGASPTTCNVSKEQVSVLESFEDRFERDLGPLCSCLIFISNISRHLRIEAITYAAEILLRLGMDTRVLENVEVLQLYQSAMRDLATAVPSSAWDNFCENVGLSFCMTIQEASLHFQALSCMAASAEQVHDLRRRLACACFFDDPIRARQRPDSEVSIRAVIDRLEANEFIIDADTAYHELTALVQILDIVVDDASHHALQGATAEDHFNIEVDELALRLNRIWRSIDSAGAGYISRLDTKTMLECVQDRLKHSVRTRPPPKKSIFDIPQERLDPDLPRQQVYMKKFFRGGSPTPA